MKYILREWLAGYGPGVRYFLLSDLFFGMAQGLANLLLNLHLLALGFSADHIGRLQALGALVMATLAIPAGLLADRWGRRFFYVAGSYGFGLPILALPWVGSFSGLTALYAVYFFSFTLMFTTEFPILAEEAPPDRRTRLFSLVFVNFFVWNSLGTLIGGLLPRWLPPGSTPYHWPLVLAGVLGLGAGVIRQLMPLEGRYRETPGTAAQAGPGAGGGVAGRARGAVIWTLLLMGSVSALTGAAGALGQNFGNVILKERFLLPDPAIGRLITLSGVAGAVSNLAVPRLGDRLGQVRGIVAASLLAVPAYLAAGYSPGLAPYLGGFYLATVLQFMARPLSSSFAMSVVPAASRSAMSSFQMVGYNAGTALAARFYGAHLARGDYRSPFLLAAALALGAALVFALGFGRRRPRGVADPGP